MSNCLISFFCCCNRKKNEIAPIDYSNYSSSTHNASTQTKSYPVFFPLSLQALPPEVSHRRMIMIRKGDSFQSQSSEDHLSFTPRVQLLSPQPIKPKCKNVFQTPFVYTQGMPKLNPVTPLKRKKTSIRLPEIKKAKIRFENPDEEIQKVVEESFLQEFD